MIVIIVNSNLIINLVILIDGVLTPFTILQAYITSHDRNNLVLLVQKEQWY